MTLPNFSWGSGKKKQKKEKWIMGDNEQPKDYEDFQKQFQKMNKQLVLFQH